MKNEKVITIRFSEIYEKSISSRAAISNVITKYRFESDLTIRFDFSQMIFISRSAAQQLILEKKKFAANHTSFVFENVDLRVNKMLELAENKLTRKNPEVKQVEFASAQELETFMLSF